MDVTALSTDLITVEQQGTVAVIWLDHPEQRNAFGPQFWVEFPAIVGALGVDPDIRALVVAATGEAFTVGLDLKAFAPSLATGSLDPAAPAPPSPVAARRATYRLIKRMQETFTSLAQCPKPVIAAVHGYCIGAGVDLITACDMRYAARDTTFSIRETKLAMVADVGTLQRLPRLVDAGTVADLVYTGRDFGADEALRVGLVGRVAPDAAQVLEAALETAHLIAANSPLAVQGSKAVLRAGDGRNVADHLDYVALWNAAFLHSGDLAEAMAAFIERRDPEFDGR